MGRQTQRTQQTIYNAFSDLLMQKSFSKVTMQEVADLANVGRSTLYSHFETKEALLSSMCEDIFSKMFTKEHIAHASYDEMMIALLTHIKENKKIIMGIFLGENTDAFATYCKHYFSSMLDSLLFFNYNEETMGVPKDFLINHIIGSFIEMIRWWSTEKMKQSPEEMTGYFFRVISPILREKY